MLAYRKTLISTAATAATLAYWFNFREQNSDGGFKISSAIPTGLDLKRAKVTLYQYESCPFCRKVRGALDYAKVPYELVEVHPLTKSETRGFAGDYAKVPVLTVASTENFQLRESRKIVSAVLGSKESSNASLLAPVLTWPKTQETWKNLGENLSPSTEWIRWVDSYLVQLVVINIYRSLSESKQTFNYLLTHKEFSAVSRFAVFWSGTAVMTWVARKRRKSLGIKAGEERRALCEALRMFVETGLGTMNFLGGQEPSEADFNVFGVIRSMEGFDTQSEIFSSVLGVEAWYRRMSEKVGYSMVISHENAGVRGNRVLGNV